MDSNVFVHHMAFLWHSIVNLTDELRQVTVCKLSYQHFCYQGEHSTESQDRKHKNGWRSEPRGRCVRYRLLRSHLEIANRKGEKVEAAESQECLSNLVDAFLWIVCWHK